jgi:hypothetical protein
MIYKGFRMRDGTCRVTRNGKKLDLHLELRNHSPTGFEWGYGGSGPSQTALAVLADFLDDGERALRLYQKFKWQVVSQFPHRGWTLSDKSLRAWVTMQEREEAA